MRGNKKYSNAVERHLLFKTWRCISCLSNVASAQSVPYVATLFGDISCTQTCTLYVTNNKTTCSYHSYLTAAANNRISITGLTLNND